MLLTLINKRKIWACACAREPSVARWARISWEYYTNNTCICIYLCNNKRRRKKEEPLLLILKKYLDDIWNNASSQTRIYPLQVKQFKIEHMKRKIYICLCCCCYCCCFCCYCKFLEYMAGLMTICSICNYLV